MGGCFIYRPLKIVKKTFLKPLFDLLRKPDSIFGYEIEDFEVLEIVSPANFKTRIVDAPKARAEAAE